MAPADLRKEGAAYDLTLAMGIFSGLQANSFYRFSTVYDHGRIVFRWQCTTYKRSFTYCY